MYFENEREALSVLLRKNYEQICQGYAAACRKSAYHDSADAALRGIMSCKGNYNDDGGSCGEVENIGCRGYGGFAKGVEISLEAG